MSINFSGKTDIGYKMNLNEDLIVAETLSYNKDFGDDYLLMILDGNGASIKAQQSPNMVIQPVNLVANAILSLLKSAYNEDKDTFLSDPMAFLKTSFRAANISLGTFKLGDEEKYGNFSSCITAVFFHGDKGVGLHCGNTRAYIFKQLKNGNMALKQLTKDQTVGQQKIDAGKLDPEEYYRSPERLQLYSALGIGAEPVFMPFTVNLTGSDIFILTTDGVHYAHTKDDLVSHLMSAPNIGTLIDHIISESKRLELIDNIGIILAYRKEWVEENMSFDAIQEDVGL